jgi:hypothetical protein
MRNMIYMTKKISLFGAIITFYLNVGQRERVQKVVYKKVIPIYNLLKNINNILLKMEGNILHFLLFCILVIKCD